MSNCMNGGRFTHRWSDQVWHTPQGNGVHAPVRPVFIVVHFTDGTEAERTFSREVNGVEREVSWVEVDGRRFEDIEMEIVEHFRDGYRYAIELDGVRYVPAPIPDHDSEVCE